MGRHARRFGARVRWLAAATLITTAAYVRWRQLLPLSQADTAVSFASLPAQQQQGDDKSNTTTACARREQHWRQLQHSSTPQTAYDVLVIGGGMTGLYCAVDAAARGLRVALVDAHDWGGDGHSTHTPPLAAGVFAYVQRALRQRETAWLRRAYATLCAERTWRRVAPHCCVLPTTPPLPPPPRQCRLGEHKDDNKDNVRAMHTLVVSNSFAEAVEATLTTWLSRALSLLQCGVRTSWQQAHTLSSRTVDAILQPTDSADETTTTTRVTPTHADEQGSCGNDNDNKEDVDLVVRPRRRATVMSDIVLDTTAATVALAQTAERLGVTLLNYAEVRGLRYVGDDGDVVQACVCDTSTAYRNNNNNNVSKGNDDDNRHGVVHVCARGVVNCAGSRVDAVRSLVTMADGSRCRSADAVRAFAQFIACVYLVTPRDAVTVTTQTTTTTALPLMSRLPAAVDALELRSVAYTAASTMVLPWYDDCVLIGPTRFTLSSSSSQQQQHNNNRRAATDAAAAVPHVDDVCAMRDSELPHTYALRALRACGVHVQPQRVLSCLTDIVPVLTPSRAVPWASALYEKGYAVTVWREEQAALMAAHATAAQQQQQYKGDNMSSNKDSEDDWSNNNSNNDDVAGMQACIVHVYGGVPLLARDVAEAAVDKLLQHSPALQTTRPCCTRTLALAAAAAPPLSSSLSSLSSPASARIEHLVRDTYVVRLSDVLLRRCHVGYSSPQQALQALPSLARVVAPLQGWSDARTAREVADARACIERIAVAHA